MAIDDASEIARKLEPILGKRAGSLWRLYLDSANTEEIIAMRSLMQLVAARERTLNFNRPILLPPPERGLLLGPIKLGKVVYPDRGFSEFGLSKNDFTRHTLISGMTGAGKTNLCLSLLSQLAIHDTPVLIFDWKQNYRKLAAQREFAGLRIIRPELPERSFRFNPLIPPNGIEAKHWMGLVVDVIKHSFYVLFGPEYFFRKGIHALYGQKGVYDGHNEYPTFAELEKLLKSEYVRGRELLWMSSVKRVLNALGKMGILGHVVNVPYSDDLETILNTPTIIELDGLPILERTFLTEAILLWIYHYRKLQGSTSNLRHVILLEEAHHVLSLKKERMQGEESIIELMVRMAREFGQGLIVVDQEPSKLSRSVLANTGCKICMCLGNGWDINAMAEAMCLSNDERPFLGRLPIGSAIATISRRFPQPILLQCPLFTSSSTLGERRFSSI